MRTRIIVALGFVTGVVLSSAALGQDGELTEMWVNEHAQVVERLIRAWLADPHDPAIDRATVRLVQLETYLEVSRADVRLYLPRINPEVSLPPQLLITYLEERGVRLRPRHLLVDRTFIVSVE